MIRGELVEAITASAYRDGAHPVDVAELIISLIAEQSGLACQHCRTKLAREILAALLDAGWRMPEPP